MADQRESIDKRTDFIVDEDGTAYDVREKSNVGELTVKVNADFSEMITGLKAVERQAKAAKRAVAELGETASEKEIDRLATFLLRNYPFEVGKHGVSEGAVSVALRLIERGLSDYSTKELADELAKRECVTEIDARSRVTITGYYGQILALPEEGAE